MGAEKMRRFIARCKKKMLERKSERIITLGTEKYGFCLRCERWSDPATEKEERSVLALIFVHRVLSRGYDVTCTSKRKGKIFAMACCEVG